jgi:hypothetical protein
MALKVADFTLRGRAAHEHYPQDDSEAQRCKKYPQITQIKGITLEPTQSLFVIVLFVDKVGRNLRKSA